MGTTEPAISRGYARGGRSPYRAIHAAAALNVASTTRIMPSRPPVLQTTVGTLDLCTVWIHHEVLAKLSNAVLPSSAATPPTAPAGGRQAVSPASGLTSRSPSPTRRQGDS